MEKEFVPYEESLALKKFGFDEPCFGYYESTYGKEKVIIEPSKLITNSNYSKVFNEIRYRIVTPTFSQAFRWFREKYGLHRHICYFEDTHFWHGDLYRLKDSGLMNYPMELTGYKTYEEAELACLKKLIEIVKNLK